MAVITTTRSWAMPRDIISAGAITLALPLMAAAHNYDFLLYPAAWTLMAIGVLSQSRAGILPKLWPLFAILLLSAWAAVPLGNGLPMFIQVFYPLYLSAGAMLLFARPTRQLQAGIFLLGAIEALLVWTSPFGRAEGFLGNPNVSAGFILFAASVGIRRWPWAAVLLLACLPLSGSRLAMLALGLLMGLWVITRTMTWKQAAVLGVLLGFSWMLSDSAVMRTANISGDLAYRLSSPESGWLDWLIPSGPVPTPGLHNVPQRIAYEFGLLAAIAWCAIMAYALLRKPRLTPAWWGLLAITLLSTLDFYFWQPVLWGAWWLTVGMRLQEPA